MHRNAVWLSFFLGVILLTSWFAFNAGYKLWKYSQLSDMAPIKITRIKILEDKPQKFRIVVFYSFEYRGKIYDGNGSWGNHFLNIWSAEKDAQRIEENLKIVWFDPDNPSHSSPEKRFPRKQTLSAAVLFGLSIYFLSLGFYVSKKRIE
jgi:hypothetical protein